MKRTFKIDFVEGHLLIRDNENIILVDTGSPVTMHKEGTLSFLGREHRVLSKGVDYLSRLAGVEFTTLMGMDILSQYRVVFDYENEEITFLTHDEAGLEGVEMALPSLMGMILVNMQIAGRQCLMALDTGAPVSYLDDSITCGMQPVGEKEDFHPMAGRYVTPVYELEAEVGGKTFSATFGNLPTVMALQLKLLGVDGVIGYDFFKSFKVMIDVAGSKVVISCVNYLDPQCLESGQLPVEELLRDSVYYPACAFDGGIIRLFNTRLPEEGVTSFVYCDFYADEERLVEDVRKHMRGYHILADRTVQESEFVKGTRVDFPFDMRLADWRAYERIMDDCLPFCHWFIFERDADFGPEHGPERFSLLYVCGESVATYIGLYNAYGVAPKALALVQCDGFSGNWTHFRSADGPLRVVMAQNEGGMPKYVINGGIGSADGYDNLGWSDYEEVDAVQPYYRSVWHECVVHDGGLVIYKRK